MVSVNLNPRQFRMVDYVNRATSIAKWSAAIVARTHHNVVEPEAGFDFRGAKLAPRSLG